MSLDGTATTAPRTEPREAIAPVHDAARSEGHIFSILSQYAVMQVVLAATGLVRNKVVALRLGPSSFGEISQIAAVVGVAATIVSFGMSVSLSRNAAKGKTLKERAEHLANANGIVLGLSAIALLVLLPLLASGHLLSLGGLTPSRTATWTAALFVVAIPLEGLKSNYFAFLQGILDVKGLALGRSIAVVAATIVAIPVVWFFGFIGAAVQALLLSALVALLLGWRCRALGYSPLRARLEPQKAILLGSFGLVSMASSFAQILADTAVRSRLIETSGAVANGLVQAPYVLAITLKTVVLASIGSVSLATIAPSEDRREISAAVDRLLNVVVPLGAAALGALGLAGVPALRLLYSEAFAPGAAFFAWVLSADLLLVFVWVIGAPLLAFGDRMIWLGLDLAFAAVRWAVALALLPRLGGHAVVVGYLAGVAIHLALNLGIYWRRYGLHLAPRHLYRLVFGVALVAALSVAGAQAPAAPFAIGAALVAWVLYTVHYLRHSGILLAVQSRVRRG